MNREQDILVQKNGRSSCFWGRFVNREQGPNLEVFAEACEAFTIIPRKEEGLSGIHLRGGRCSLHDLRAGSGDPECERSCLSELQQRI